MSNILVYRAGVSNVDPNGHRFIFSETMYCAAPRDNQYELDAINWLCFRCRALADVPGGFQTSQWRIFGGVIYPFVRDLKGHTITPNTLPYAKALNPAAPEAAFRLQRVGASGKSGRTAVPILDDEMFTDRPRRRHVNVAALQAQVDWVNELRGLSVTTLSGKVYKQCVFHRQSASVTDVVSMRVLSNPIRIWQRWRTYDPTQHEGSDVRYCPDEMDY